MIKLLIQHFSRNHITFLNEIYYGKYKQMFTIGHYKYFKINHGNNIYDINKDNIIQFLSILNPNYGYIVTATICFGNCFKLNLPFIVLGHQILVSRDSNSTVLLKICKHSIVNLNRRL